MKAWNWTKKKTRKAGYAITNKSEAEKLVYEATSSDKWGASNTQLFKIAQLSNGFKEYDEITQALWKRINDDEIRRQQKAMILLEYLIINGNERFRSDSKINMGKLQAMKQAHKYEKGEEAALEAVVRKKAENIILYLNDDEVYRMEREKAARVRNSLSSCSNVDKMGPMTTTEQGFYHSDYNNNENNNTTHYDNNNNRQENAKDDEYEYEYSDEEIPSPSMNNNNQNSQQQNNQNTYDPFGNQQQQQRQQNSQNGFDLFAGNQQQQRQQNNQNGFDMFGGNQQQQQQRQQNNQNTYDLFGNQQQQHSQQNNQNGFDLFGNNQQQQRQQNYGNNNNNMYRNEQDDLFNFNAIPQNTNYQNQEQHNQKQQNQNYDFDGLVDLNLRGGNRKDYGRAADVQRGGTSMGSSGNNNNNLF